MNRLSVWVILFVFASCINSREQDHKILCHIDCSSLCAGTSEILTTHLLNVQCGGTFLPLRNQILTGEELDFSQQNSSEAKAFNDKVIIENLNNGAWLKVLKADTLGYHYVQVIDRINNDETKAQRGVKGYILSKFCGLPTIEKIERVAMPLFSTTDDSFNTIEFLGYYKFKSDILSYAFACFSDEADLIQVFSFDVNGLNSIRYKMQVVWGQQSTLLFDGDAMLLSSYLNSSGKLVSVFSCEPVLGYRYEIHMCLSENIAFIKYLDSELTKIYNSSTTPVPTEQVMHRFK
jgi:hypothetical protein